MVRQRRARHRETPSLPGANGLTDRAKRDFFSTAGDCPGPDQDLDRQITPKQHGRHGQALLLPGSVVFGVWVDGSAGSWRGYAGVSADGVFGCGGTRLRGM